MLKLFRKSRVWKEFSFWKNCLLMCLPMFVLASVIATIFMWEGSLWAGVLCVFLLGIPTFWKIIFSPYKSWLFAFGDRGSGWRVYYIGKKRWRFVVYDGDDVQLYDVVNFYPNEDYNVVIVEDMDNIHILFACRNGKLYREVLGRKEKHQLYVHEGAVNCCILREDGRVAEVVEVAIMKDWKVYADLLFYEKNCSVVYHDYLYYDHIINNAERDNILTNSWDYVYILQRDEKGVCSILELFFDEMGYVSNILRIETNSKNVKAYTDKYSSSPDSYHYYALQNA